MQKEFLKFWKESRQTQLDESQIDKLVEQIIDNIDDEDPAWQVHVKQALVNKGVQPKDIQRVLIQLKDEFLNRIQSKE
jgi:hypothetical protein